MKYLIASIAFMVIGATLAPDRTEWWHYVGVMAYFVAGQLWTLMLWRNKDARPRN